MIFKRRDLSRLVLRGVLNGLNRQVLRCRPRVPADDRRQKRFRKSEFLPVIRNSGGMQVNDQLFRGVCCVRTAPPLCRRRLSLILCWQHLTRTLAAVEPIASAISAADLPSPARSRITTMVLGVKILF